MTQRASSTLARQTHSHGVVAMRCRNMFGMVPLGPLETHGLVHVAQRARCNAEMAAIFAGKVRSVVEPVSKCDLGDGPARKPRTQKITMNQLKARMQDEFTDALPARSEHLLYVPYRTASVFGDLIQREVRPIDMLPYVAVSATEPLRISGGRCTLCAPISAVLFADRVLHDSAQQGRDPLRHQHIVPMTRNGEHSQRARKDTTAVDMQPRLRIGAGRQNVRCQTFARNVQYQQLRIDSFWLHLHLLYIERGQLTGRQSARETPLMVQGASANHLQQYTQIFWRNMQSERRGITTQIQPRYQDRANAPPLYSWLPCRLARDGQEFRCHALVSSVLKRGGHRRSARRIRCLNASAQRRAIVVTRHTGLQGRQKSRMCQCWNVLNLHSG